MAQEKVLWIDFKDKVIDKLFIKSGIRITVKFKNVKVPYLTGLVLRCSPLTQKKKFYLKYSYKDKSKKLNLNEFVFGHSGTLEVSEALLELYKKYYKAGHWRHDPQEQLITLRVSRSTKNKNLTN